MKLNIVTVNKYIIFVLHTKYSDYSMRYKIYLNRDHYKYVIRCNST